MEIEFHQVLDSLYILCLRCARIVEVVDVSPPILVTIIAPVAGLNVPIWG